MAAQILNKDICISAHIYDVVQLPDGTRFLDVCSPQTPDDQCRFTVVSLPADRTEVGELTKYRDADVQIRGIVQPMHGRAGMVLSHARQFYGGPPKFKPNPLLARGFSAEQGAATCQRSQPAPTGRPPRIHEHARSGAVAGKVVTAAESARFFQRRRKLRARKKNRARDDQENERSAQPNAQVRSVADGADHLRRKRVTEKVNAKQVD